MSKETHFHLPMGQPEIVVREGAAETIVYPKGININGILAAPHQFYEGKIPKLNALDCHILIEKDKGTITLIVHDTDNRGSSSSIKGALKPDNVLSSWMINTENHRWTVSSLIKQLMMYKSFFADRNECETMIKSLRNWSASIETVIRQHNDNTGNSLSVLEKKVRDVELKNKFVLHIPIFQGYPKEKFTVEIGLDPKSNAVEIFLYSEELFALTIDRRESILGAELALFEEFQCSKVVLS